MNIWFDGLKRDETGARVFGIFRYTKPPEACPPTLTLAMGGEAFDIDKIEIPPNVEVMAFVSDKYRAEHSGSNMLESLDKFIKTHGGQYNVGLPGMVPKP